VWNQGRSCPDFVLLGLFGGPSKLCENIILQLGGFFVDCGLKINSLNKNFEFTLTVSCSGVARGVNYVRVIHSGCLSVLPPQSWHAVVE